MKRGLELVLNITTGTVIPRTPATDDNPVIFRRIDVETARAINTGKVKAAAVIEALEKIERSAPDFSWKEYDKKRRAAEKMLNVSRRDMTPVSDEPEEAAGTEKDVKVVSLKDLFPEADESAKPAEAAKEPAAAEPKRGVGRPKKAESAQAEFPSVGADAK